MLACAELCAHAGLRHEAAVLPFELHVLEVAIGDVCALCTQLVKDLESSSHPALDALTKHVGSCPSWVVHGCCATLLNGFQILSVGAVRMRYLSTQDSVLIYFPLPGCGTTTMRMHKVMLL